MRYLESQLQRAVIDHLKWRAKPGVLWLHPANGGKRDAREAARFKREGVLPGASDILLWHRGSSFALELKSENGRPSDAQKEFQYRFTVAGGHTATVHGIDEALDVLKGWDLLTGRTRCSA